MVANTHIQLFNQFKALPLKEQVAVGKLIQDFLMQFIEKKVLDDENMQFKQFSAQNLAKAFGNDEPDYE